MQEMMLYSAQESVYSLACKNLEKYFHFDVDAKQMERLVHAYGNDVAEEFDSCEGKLLPSAKEGERTYVMMDGSMISTREDGWKEVKLGRIFAASDHLPADINRNWIRDSVYIGILGSHTDFLKKMEPTVDRLKNPVFINDGARWIWAWAEQYYPNSTQILDFFHAVEHLNEFAAEYFKVREELKKWVLDQTQSLLEDDIEDVIKDIENLKPKTKKGKKAQRLIVNYYRKNQRRMMYKTFRDKGMMIGSGPIEAAHRNVIQGRLKRSGQRWTIKGANAIIQIRTALMSNKWGLVIKSIKNAA